MHCIHCSTKNEDSASFCTRCGKRMLYVSTPAKNDGGADATALRPQINEKVKLHLKTTRKNYCNFTVIDFETTGFSCLANEIIEYAAVKVTNCQIVDSISHLCKPNTPISRSITNLTGITNTMVEGAESFDVYLPKLLHYIGDDVIVAHNASFDIGFLQAYCNQNGLSFGNKTGCTLVASRAAFPQLSNHKLQTVAAYCNVESKEQHRALGDAIATAKILIRILSQSEIAV